MTLLELDFRITVHTSSGETVIENWKGIETVLGGEGGRRGEGVRAGKFGELPAGCITIRTILELYKRACNRVQLREAREEKKNDKDRHLRLPRVS